MDNECAAIVASQAALNARVNSIEAREKANNERQSMEIATLEADVRKIKEQQTKWKAAITVLISIGGIVAAALQLWADKTGWFSK